MRGLSLKKMQRVAGGSGLCKRKDPDPAKYFTIRNIFFNNFNFFGKKLIVLAKSVAYLLLWVKLLKPCYFLK